MYRLNIDEMDSIYKLLVELYPSLKIKQRHAAIMLSYIKRRQAEPHRDVSHDFKIFAFNAASDIRMLNK